MTWHEREEEGRSVKLRGRRRTSVLIRHLNAEFSQSSCFGHNICVYASASQNLSIFNLSNCFYALGKLICDVHPVTGTCFFPITDLDPVLRYHKTLDPGSGSTTLQKTEKMYGFHNIFTSWWKDPDLHPDPAPLTSGSGSRRPKKLRIRNTLL